jgi:ribosome modulation factor
MEDDFLGEKRRHYTQQHGWMNGWREGGREVIY